MGDPRQPLEMATTMELMCYVTTIPYPFILEVPRGIDVEELKRLIIRETKLTVSLSLLAVYKFGAGNPLLEEPVETIQERAVAALAVAEGLVPSSTIDSHFPESTPIPMDRIHILVTIKDIAKRKTYDDPDDERPNKRRNVDFFRNIPAPSVGPSTFRDMNVSDGTFQILNHRPLTARGPPATLYHPAFAPLANCIDNDAANIDPDLCKVACEACWISGILFSSELARKDAMRPFFEKVFGSLVRGKGTEANDVVSSGHDNYVIFEYRTELGSGTKDAYIQGGQRYAKLWAKNVEGTVQLRKHSVCPTIIILVAGQYLRVCAAF
ncbi:hypothetical protein FRB93_002995 [Tulasnella sp. JGI-2019a]|nr:hypothetical protein FRB93_002995 [Tulasnella sp. JGI-2019a]